jgi:hypothetical protein
MYLVAPAEANQTNVGVRLVSVGPGLVLLPGASSVGAAGTVATLTVKYTTDEVALEPAELEAETAQKYVAPFCNAGQVAEFVVTFSEHTTPPFN